MLEGDIMMGSLLLLMRVALIYFEFFKGSPRSLSPPHDTRNEYTYSPLAPHRLSTLYEIRDEINNLMKFIAVKM